MSNHRSSPRIAVNFNAVVLAMVSLFLLHFAPARADQVAGLLKVGLTADDSKAVGTTKESKASLGKPQAASARSGTLMRCWNYGRLVYESPVGGFIASTPNSNVVTIPGSPQKQVLDMRSGLCVIE